jgi:hypothetical protein
LFDPADRIVPAPSVEQLRAAMLAAGTDQPTTPATPATPAGY